MTSISTKIDVLLSIQKRKEFADYKAQASLKDVLLDYIESEPLSVGKNLSIVDHSATLVSNRLIDTSKYEVLEDGASLTVDTDRIAITDLFTIATATQSAAPLFFRHSIPTIHYDPTSGHKIISLKILNSSLIEQSISNLLFDTETGYLYNNLESFYNEQDGTFETYYIQYSVKESVSSVKTYLRLLDNELIYRIATLDDISPTGTLLQDGRKVYLSEELSGGTFLITLPTSQRYAFRRLKNSRIAILAPAVTDIDLPWYLRVSDGKFFTTLDSVAYKYHIAEIYTQQFVPYLPYRLARNVNGIILNQNILKLAHETIYENSVEALGLDILLYDENDSLKYALSTNESQYGLQAGLDANGVVISFDVLSKGSSRGIRSVDHRNGFADIQGLNLLDYTSASCVFYYECADLEINSVNINPIQNKEILDKHVILFLIPSLLTEERDKSIYLFIVNEDGLVLDSDWDVWAILNAAGDFLFLGTPPSWFVTAHPSATCSNFTEIYSVMGNGNYLILGEVFIKHSQSIQDLVLMDIRQQGGGISSDSPLVDSVEYPNCWDVGCFDGKPYPGPGNYLVELPSSVLEGATGKFKAPEIRNIVAKHTALGIYPIIRTYGIDPRITSILPGDQSLIISWTHHAPDVYYNIYISRSKDGPFSVANINPIQEGTNLFTIETLTNDTTYFLYVVGGKYIETIWTPFSEQIIGEQITTAIGASTLEFMKAIPGIS
jgi:hypothetical protein